jgi:hypothetical protein
LPLSLVQTLHCDTFLVCPIEYKIFSGQRNIYCELLCNPVLHDTNCLKHCTNSLAHILLNHFFLSHTYPHLLAWSSIIGIFQIFEYHAQSPLFLSTAIVDIVLFPGIQPNGNSHMHVSNCM